MKPKVEQRPVDRQYETYNQMAQQSANKFTLYPAILLFTFGLLVVIWAVPFPYISFFGRYNGYLNFASFFIAGLIYYYLRLSPVLSYVTLFLLFAFSFLIIQLEQWQKAGGPYLWVVGLTCLIIGIIMQYTILRAGKHIYLLAYSVVWLLVGLFKKLKLKY